MKNATPPSVAAYLHEQASRMRQDAAPPRIDVVASLLRRDSHRLALGIMRRDDEPPVLTLGLERRLPTGSWVPERTERAELRGEAELQALEEAIDRVRRIRSTARKADRS